MPNLASARKELRKSARRNAGNRVWKMRMKRLMKETRELAASGKKDEAQKLLPQLYKTVDKMAKKHRIAKNKANRIKSRVTRASTERKA